MLEHIKTLEQRGAWQEIRTSGLALCAGLEGDALARVYLSLSKAHEETATGSGDYLKGLEFAKLALSSATPGTQLHAWSLARCAAMSADAGEYKGAERFALEFLRVDHTEAETMLPYALFALGRAQSRFGRHSDAITSLKQALSVASGELRERVQLTLCRAYARAGKLSDAVSVCPNEVQFVSIGKPHATRALIYANCRDWQAAQLEGRLALSYINRGEFRTHDVIEVAELLLTLKVAAHALGQHREAAVWLVQTAALLSSWGAGLVIPLLSTLLVKGGDFDAATSHCGPAGSARCGLRGAVG